MKVLLLIILFFYSAECAAQQSKTSTIEFSTLDCRSNYNNSSRFTDTVFFSKMPEDTVSFAIVPTNERRWPVKIEKAPIGNYKLRYKNYYGQEVTELITVTQKSINSVVICPDKLTSYPQNTLEKFQDNDSISIIYHSQGCFHTDIQRLCIKKEKGKFLATLYSAGNYYPHKKEKHKVEYRDIMLLKSVIMTEQNIKDFIRFENDLNYANDDGCTTTDYYRVQSKFLNISRTDGSCRWSGFYFLKELIFGKEKTYIN